MRIVKGFAAGFAATLIFHQGVYALFHAVGLLANPPFSLAPTWPFGIPAVLSLAFWGGLWGVVLLPLLKAPQAPSYWFRGMAAGAVGPTAVALLIVFPLKGMPVAAGWDPLIIGGALVLNGAWGFGVCLFLRWLER